MIVNSERGGGYTLSDITLADFWGVEHVSPEFDDDKGTSLVIVNTKKGTELFKTISESVIYKKVMLNEATRYNPSMYYSNAKPKNRDAFMKEIFVEPFDKVVDKYSPRRRFLRTIKRWLKKIMVKFLR